MRRFCVFVCFLAPAVGLAASQNRPVTSTELMAWLASGVSNNRLRGIIQQTGALTVPSKEEIKQLERAGADAELIKVLTTCKPAVSCATEDELAQFPDLLAQAAADSHAQHLHQAEIEFRQLVQSDPQNAAFHFALGTMLRQQERWDDAYDQLAESTRLMPGFPENHNALAYVFFCRAPRAGR
jgi:Flp pilus assembly protein TadD